MRLGRPTIVLLAFCGAFWIGLAAQVPQQTNQAGPTAIDVPLAAAGAPTPTGLNVTRGDRLRFEARPANDNSRVLMANFPPSFTASIGQEAFRISPGREVIAPASGELSIAVSFPDQIPQSRWPAVVMHIEHEAQVPEIVIPPEANNFIEVNNFAENLANNLLEENNLSEAENEAATPEGNLANNAATAAGGTCTAPPCEPPPPPDDRTWLLVLLAAAGGIVLLLWAGREIWQRINNKDRPPLDPHVGILPSLDPLEGGVTGDAIALAGPEIRLRGTLEPGETMFDGGEPAIERESRDE